MKQLLNWVITILFVSAILWLLFTGIYSSIEHWDVPETTGHKFRTFWKPVTACIVLSILSKLFVKK